MAQYKILWDDTLVPELDVEHQYFKEHQCENEYQLVLGSVTKEPAKFWEEAADADAVSAYIPFTEEHLDLMPRCKVVAVPALGTDFIFAKPATKRGICMTNLPTYCSEEVATHTAALILDCVRRITRLDRRLKSGVWDWTQRGYQHRLTGRNYGLVSFGNIARRAGAMMQAFGVNLLAFDPFLPDAVFEAAGALRCETMEELFSRCDIISVHTPLTEKTRHMIGKRQFDAIQDELLFVVTGRGGVVDEEALYAAILDGKIPAAGLDVIEDEVTCKSILTDLPEVVMTPHLGYYSEESEKDLRIFCLDNILDVLEHKKYPSTLVNKEVVGKTRIELL